MKLSHRSLGAVLITATIAAALLFVPGTSVSAFVDIPSLVWIVGIVAGGLFVGFPVESVIQSFSSCFQKKRALNSQKLEEYLKILSNAYQLSWGAGIVGSLFGLIIMLSNVESPSSLGSGLSVSLLMLLYAGILSEIVISGFQQVLISKVGSSSPGASSSPQSNPIVPQRSMIGKVAAVTLLIFLQFSVLLTSLPSLSYDSDNALQTSWIKSRSLANRPVHRHPATAKDGKWYSFISADNNQ